MNLQQAVVKGIVRLRRPEWAAGVYVKIDLCDDSMGPWVHLYDRCSQQAIGTKTPEDVIWLSCNEDDYEEYEGELDREDGR